MMGNQVIAFIFITIMIKTHISNTLHINQHAFSNNKTAYEWLKR